MFAVFCNRFRKNVAMLGIELMLTAAALTFLCYTKYFTGNIDGHIMSLFIIVIAAASCCGTWDCDSFFQIKESIHIDSNSTSKLKGLGL